MNGLIDIRTASLLTCVVGVIFCFYMVHFGRTRKTYSGFRLWTLASLCVFSSMGLIFLRNVLPDFISVVVSNLLVVTAIGLITRGLAAFTGQRVSHWWLSLPLAVTFGFSIAFTYYQYDIRGRIISVSLVNGIMYAHCLMLVRRLASSRRQPAGWLTLSLGLMAAWFLLRAVLTLLFEDTVSDFMAASSIQGFTFVCYSAGNIGIFLGLLVLVSHRTEAELQQALEEVSALQGIIPICSTCKKIRDDQGAWNQLESYISRHSQARFSHGYCPDCASKVMAAWSTPPT